MHSCLGYKDHVLEDEIADSALRETARSLVYRIYKGKQENEIIHNSRN